MDLRSRGHSRARNLTKEQVIHDVLLEAQPTKEFVTSEQVAALALFLCSNNAAQITAQILRSTVAVRQRRLLSHLCAESPSGERLVNEALSPGILMAHFPSGWIGMKE